MICASWNIRGFSLPLKHNGVRHLIKEHNIDVLAILEAKISAQKLAWLMNVKFPGWRYANNFDHHVAGRIFVMWNPSKVDLVTLGLSAQVIHCKVSCLISSKTFCLSFVYGLHSIVNRRPLWSDLGDFSLQCTLPWLIMGDFNSILSAGERVNGAEVSSYEISDFHECCLSNGLSDLQSMGSFFTWSNNTVWTKLDRALVNSCWWDGGFSGMAHFLPPGCLSDHSAAVVSIFDQSVGKKKPFRFFNMWADHVNFLPLVQSVWTTNVDGVCQFLLCKKLSLLKMDLKKLNAVHFSHISARAQRASKVLKDAQIQLSNDPSNLVLREQLPGMRKEARFLADAEGKFLSQK